MLRLVPRNIIERSPGSKRFIEDQVLLQSYDLAPPPLRSASCLSFSVYLYVEHSDGGGGGEGKGRSQIIRKRESWSSINHSILSAQAHAPFAGIGLYLPLPPSAYKATLSFPLFLNLSSLCVELEVCNLCIYSGWGGGGPNHTTKKSVAFFSYCSIGWSREKGEGRLIWEIYIQYVHM